MNTGIIVLLLGKRREDTEISSFCMNGGYEKDHFRMLCWHEFCLPGMSVVAH
jgi:hypothetical protein